MTEFHYGAPPKPEDMPQSDVQRHYYGAPPPSQLSHEEALRQLRAAPPHQEDWQSRMTGKVRYALSKLWNSINANLFNPGPKQQGLSESQLDELAQHVAREAAARR
jgi:hypothetical protein